MCHEREGMGGGSGSYEVPLKPRTCIAIRSNHIQSVYNQCPIRVQSVPNQCPIRDVHLPIHTHH
jgi:hypothetical protein